MKFAFMILGPFDMERDRAVIKNGNAQIVGVRNLDAACEMAKRLQVEGVDCLEVCGAFGEAGTRRLVEATGGTLPIGYVTHLPEQDPVFDALFKK